MVLLDEKMMPDDNILKTVQDAVILRESKRDNSMVEQLMNNSVKEFKKEIDALLLNPDTELDIKAKEKFLVEVDNGSKESFNENVKQALFNAFMRKYRNMILSKNPNIEQIYKDAINSFDPSKEVLYSNCASYLDSVIAYVDSLFIEHLSLAVRIITNQQCIFGLYDKYANDILENSERLETSKIMTLKKAS